jgi:hypothetical protein
MTALTNFSEAEAVKFLFTAETMGTRPTAWYVALHTADPTEDGSAAEVSGSSYARQSATFTRTDNQAINDSALTFPAATTTGYSVTHVSVWTAVTGGTCLIKGPLALAKAIAVGESANFAIGELILNVN